MMEVYPLYIFILSATRERAEVIPEELRFTPATASRHMGILLSNHFVTVEKKDGKVYYRLNSETIAHKISRAVSNYRSADRPACFQEFVVVAFLTSIFGTMVSQGI